MAIKAGHPVGAVDCDIKSLEELAKSQGNDRFLSVRADLTSEADFTKDEGQNRLRNSLSYFRRFNLCASVLADAPPLRSSD